MRIATIPAFFFRPDVKTWNKDPEELPKLSECNVRDIKITRFDILEPYEEDGIQYIKILVGSNEFITFYTVDEIIQEFENSVEITYKNKQ